MHRRPVGRSRLLAAIGALVVLAGCFLPWWTFGGADLPAFSGNAFDSTGILVFAAAIATLALVTLPYASERPVHADSWRATRSSPASAGWVCVWVIDLAASRAFQFASPPK